MKFLTKHLLGSADSWSWSADAFPPVSFCVRALVLDGMTVPPFDRHVEGNGRLREIGLDTETWLSWLASVLRQREVMGAHARTLGSPDAPRGRCSNRPVRLPRCCVSLARSIPAPRSSGHDSTSSSRTTRRPARLGSGACRTWDEQAQTTAVVTIPVPGKTEWLEALAHNRGEELKTSPTTVEVPGYQSAEWKTRAETE